MVKACFAGRAMPPSAKLKALLTTTAQVRHVLRQKVKEVQARTEEVEEKREELERRAVRVKDFRTRQEELQSELSEILAQVQAGPREE